MSAKDSLIALRGQATSINIDENLEGLAWMMKVFNSDGSKSAFLTDSKLDLDTDGIDQEGIEYEPTHQSQTSLDQDGRWLNSNTVNYFVLPGGFATPDGGPPRHGGMKLGCLGTVVYGGNYGHAIFADVGPSSKYGEGSISLHRALGFERISAEDRVIDSGIDSSVWILIYIGSMVPNIPCTQADIDAAAQPLWDEFTS